MAGLRNFGITFILSLLLFGVGGYFLVGFATSNMEDVFGAPVGLTDEYGNPAPTEDLSAQEEEDDFVVPDGDTFTALILGFDRNEPDADKPPQIDMAMLIKVYKEKREVIYISIPGTMRLFVDGNYLSLTDVFNIKGIGFLSSKITGVTGLPVNYYVTVGMDGMIRALNNLGTVSYNVPVDMVHNPNNTEQPEFSIRAGKQDLTAQGVLNVMRFKNYPATSAGETARMNTQRNMIKEICNQKLIEGSLTSAPETFKAIAANMTTNFTFDDFVKNVDLIFAYSKLEIVDTGEYPTVEKVEDGAYFLIPSVDKAINRYIEYR